MITKISLFEKVAVNIFAPAVYIIWNIDSEEECRFRDVLRQHVQDYRDILAHYKNNVSLSESASYNYNTICGYLARGVAKARMCLEKIV
ncbi:hypothetical protein J4447_03385 [Candidatus Pacearchaeota archaeon]|nr:hypothetical protein [Candidatus Pacearchaeota archaeon]